ncbi:hypothetical protein D3C79_757460 [compost metagenome]
MEELFLRTLFIGKKLDVIDQQRIDRTVITLKFFNGIVLQGFDHVLNKAFRVHIDHFGVGLAGHDAVAYRVQQVSFTQAGAAIQEQRVIGAARVIRHLAGRRARQLVGFTLNKVIKGMLWVNVGAVGKFRLRSRVVPTGAGRRHGARYRCAGCACTHAGGNGLADDLGDRFAAHFKTQQGGIRTAEIIQQAIDIV